MTSTLDTRPDGNPSPRLSAPPGWWLRPAHLIPLTFGVVILITLGLIGGQRTAFTNQLDDPVSVGFAQDMQGHHAQAVEMSAILHRRSNDPDLTLLAFDIMTTQQGQIGIMSGWLDLARQQQSSNETMAWMAHSGPMPGMASATDIKRLQTLPLPQAEELYLRLMIRHHRGALPMAQYAAEHAEHPDVRRLTTNINSGQASEIELLQDMLVQRGYTPEPGTTDNASGNPGSANGNGSDGHSS